MSFLDDCTIYVFARGDLSEQDQLIQACHAVFEMAWFNNWVDEGGKPKVVALDGGSSPKAFAKTMRKLAEKQIQRVEYTDPDKPELGITAIATLPLTKEQSLPLANYRLRRYSPVAQTSESTKETPCASAEMVAGRNPGEPNACVAQTVNIEHSATNREAAGAIPAASSKI